MKIKQLNIKGSYLINFKVHKDHRGYFKRDFCKREFTKFNINTKWVQSSVSLNKKKGTLRGFHFQKKPFQEDKLIGCVRGSFIDYILDLRINSKTYMKITKVKLSENKYSSVFIPKGCAHGFLTLENDTIITYLMSNFHSKKHESSISFFDKRFKIKFPIKPKYISKRDLKT